MAEPTLERAIELHSGGRVQDAVPLYLEILKTQPTNAVALHLLGVASRQSGNSQLAIELIQEAIKFEPWHSIFYFNLANAERDLGLIEAAIEHYRQAIKLDPQQMDFVAGLGTVLLDVKRTGDAVTLLEQARHNAPTHTDLAFVLANAYKQHGALDAAAALYRTVATPERPDIMFNLGNTLYELSRREEAREIFLQIIERAPGNAGVCNNLAHCYGNSPEALHWYRRAVELEPQNAAAHVNYGRALLLHGDYNAGFAEYEWRWRYLAMPPRPFSAPVWDGSNAPNATLLIHAEQGIGDAIQFARFIPAASARVGNIIVECHSELVALFSTLAGAAQVIARGTEWPPHDLHLPLMSLGYALGIERETIPSQIPYLSVEPAKQAKWAKHIPTANGQRIGLVWRGNADHPGDLARSLALADFAPLLHYSNIAWISLQVGAGEDDMPPPQTSLRKLDPKLGDFADTAAIISQLDLIISVDTAVGHLAGALGKPVWIIIPEIPEWRWLVDRTDSPWYPTARLFRRDFGEAPAAVISRLEAALQEWVKLKV